ncbi:TetR/AcrR family transcriptional regulator [Domibacillus sp. A3M-37]|uniref:TetR/AcrR family transcriptional regulator n=1 Tax=Domibacillus sp. A3M-37 TaxID=2962037 RepID=UPI0020B8DF34|nr:TetR/AcrR family transcriptional regulator [Domibacillus sp. A3M-37]MCP3760985.1 TetR/AcrR family transcriptional regulator [Domibacillus sp. A3M-37]
MNEKAKMIIKTSMKLFAQKGFTATSIQEIATACGISKGAFYLHFKSKEALLLAILHYYFDLLFEKLNTIEIESLPPREKFVKQIECQVREIHKHKEFLIMQARENAIPFNDEIEAFIFKMRTETHRFYHNRLFAIYGERIKPYFWDMAISLQGIEHSFLHMSMMDKVEIDYRQFAEFMLDCADDMEAGFQRRAKQPIIDPVAMNGLFKEKLNEDMITLWLTDLKAGSWTEDVHVSLDVIEQEITSGTPRAAVLRGMLRNLAEEPGLHEFMHVLKDYYKLS